MRGDHEPGLRLETVKALTQRALAAMSDPDATAAEVVSACLTLALRSVRAGQQLGIEAAPLRAAVYRLLVETADPTPQ